MTESVRCSPPPAWKLWENPIFRRYCRSRLRFRAVMVTLLLTVILSSFAYLITPMLTERMDEQRIRFRAIMEQEALKSGAGRRNLEFMREREQMLGISEPTIKHEHIYQRMALLPLLGIQALILFLLGTGQSSGGMTAERDEGMVDYQRLTPMTPLAKVLGYLFGLPVREWLMFAATLPFTALALWKGKVPLDSWLPVAVIFFTSVILYHLTGLVTGTVMKNRRWAFLLCMGLIFLLYTLVPQGARMGLPFLRYITLWPVAMESAHIFPAEQVRAWQLASGHVGGAGVDFFRWNLSELAFTLIVQGSFILTFFIMVWRKWRQSDSHLLSKGWSVLLYSWLCVLPIGNALPGIADGSLFPSQSIRSVVRQDPRGPGLEEALLMAGFYGLLMLLLLIVLAILLTPGSDCQARGLRRAAKMGRPRAPFYTDEASAFPAVLLLTLLGAASWAWFVRSLLGSQWFHSDPGLQTFGLTFALFAPVTLGFHAMLEARGGKWPFLAAIFLGVVPVLASLIVLAASRDTPAPAVMIAGASPLVWPFYGIEQLIDWPRLSDTTRNVDRTIRTSLSIWATVYGLATLLFLIGLARHWRQRRRTPAVAPK
jgi:hypothetical protein